MYRMTLACVDKKLWKASKQNIRSLVYFRRICQGSSAFPQQRPYTLQVHRWPIQGKNIGVPGERHGGRARVPIFVTALLCEAWALAGHTFLELGEKLWDPGFMGSYMYLADCTAAPQSQFGPEKPWGEPQGLSSG